MPRTTKCRKVCGEPVNRVFTPQNQTAQTIQISVEELEAVRLCDYEGMDQDTAAKQMEISRGTLQRILYSARRNIAEALCFGKALLISGGNYQLTPKDCSCPNSCSPCRLKQKENHHE